MKKILKIFALFLLFSAILLFFYRGINVGGDDSRLYFAYPQYWLQGLELNSISGYLGNFNPQFFYISFASVGMLFSFVAPEIVQSLTTITLLVISFIFTYLFIKEILELLLNKLHRDLSLISTFSALFYTFSPLLYYTVWYHPISSVVAVASFPMLSFFILKGLVTKKYRYALFGNMLLLPFSIAFASPPIFAGYLITFSVLIVVALYLARRKVNLFFCVKYLFIFFCTFTAYNLYWVLTWVSSLTTSNEAANYTTSVLGKSQAAATVYQIASKSSLLNALQNLPSLDLYGKSSYIGYNIFLSPLNLVYPLLIVIVFYILYTKKSKYLSSLTFLLIPFVFALYLHVVNFGHPGISFFIFLTEHVPGWVMFKNFFNKFAIPFVLVYAVFLSFCLVLISKYLKKQFRNLLILGLFSIVIIQAGPFITGKINKVVVPTEITEDPVERTTAVQLPTYFFDLVSDLNKMPSKERILSFPLSYASWTMFEDEFDNDIYIGLSPISSFTGLDDFNGEFAFNTADLYLPGIKKVFQNSLYNKDTTTFKKAINLLGVKYIVINKKMYQEPYKDVYEKYAWGGYDFQVLENLNDIVKDPSFRLVKSYGPDKSLLLYEFTEGSGRFSSIKKLTSYNDLSVIDLINTPYYSSDTGYVLEKDLSSEIANLVSTKIVGLDRNYYTGELPQWYKGWSWPEANVDPKNYKYPLVRFKEYLLLRGLSSGSEKIDTKIWLMAKRSEEAKRYNRPYSRNQFNLLLNSIIQDLKNTDLSDSKLEDFAKKFVSYVERSKIYDEQILSQDTSNKYLEFKSKNIKQCLYDVCYYTPEVESFYRIGGLSDESQSGTKVYLDDIAVENINDTQDFSEGHTLGVNYGDEVPIMLDSNKLSFSSISSKNNIKSLANFLENNRIIKNYIISAPTPDSNFLIKGDLDYSKSGFGIAVFEYKWNDRSGELEYINVFDKYEDILNTISLGEVIKSSKNSKEFSIYLYTRRKSVGLYEPSGNIYFKNIPNNKAFLVKDVQNSLSLDNCMGNYEVLDTESYLVKNKCTSTVLTMNDSFSSGWVLTDAQSSNKIGKVLNYIKGVTPFGTHFRVNGYQNAWYISESDNRNLFVDFLPRNLFYIGVIVSSITISLSVLLTFYLVITTSKVKSLIYGFFNRYFRR